MATQPTLTIWQALTGISPSGTRIDLLNGQSLLILSVKAFITGLMDSKSHPEQAYKACQGVLGFERKVGRERLINACRRAIEYENYSYGAIKSILENKYDMITYAEITADIPDHENIRGRELLSVTIQINTIQTMTKETLEKIKKLHLWGMARAYETSLENEKLLTLSADELIGMLVEAEWDDRQNRNLERRLRNARFRYQSFN